MTFKVHIPASRCDFTVEEGEDLITAAIRQAVALPYSCRNGQCGACKGKVLEGRVDYGLYSPYALSEQDIGAGQALFCQAKPLTHLAIEPRQREAAQDVIVKKLPCRVEKMERLTDSVMRLYLKLPSTERLPFSAGQYLDIVLRDGRRRSFSIANAPHQAGLIELHIGRIEGGEFTGHVFGGMKEKDILRIEAPLGDFTLRKDSPRPILFLAAGTGFAPIKGIIEDALMQGERRPMCLYRGAAVPGDLYLEQQVRGWLSEAKNLEYIPVLSRPEGGWRGRSGYVQEAAAADFSTLGDFDVYASGPPAMVNAARQICLARGLPPERFYFDAFEFARR